MTYLFKNVKVVQPGTEHHGKVLDLLIKDGIIVQIGSRIVADSAAVVERKGLSVSTGWVDLLANFMDPGYEHKETLQTGLDAALAGGFSNVVVTPETQPVIDSAAQVNDLLRRASGHTCSLLPTGSISKGLKQEKMAEMFDMKANGAVAFCEGKRNIDNAELMRIAMEYAVGAGVNIWSFPKDEAIAGTGYMHEGVTSTVSGIKGVPALAEELALSREIQMSRYTGCPVHFPMISSAGSVELLRNAQVDGVKVSAGVASYHLSYTEEDLLGLDANLKTDHPIRTESDRKSLRKAVQDGVITSIVSDHTPQDHEAKVREFSNADFGMINLQTSFAMVMSETDLELDTVISAFTTGPRNVLGLAEPVIAEGETAELTFFCPDEKWVFSKASNRSLSSNSPVLGQEMTGRPIAVANNGQVSLVVS